MDGSGISSGSSRQSDTVNGHKQESLLNISLLTLPADIINILKSIEPALADVPNLAETILNGNLAGVPQLDIAELFNKLPDLATLASEEAGQKLVELMVLKPLQLEDAESLGEIGDATAVMKRVSGFALQLSALSAVTDLFSKLVLGRRGGEVFSRTIGNLPAELGLNFFFGTVLHDLFIQAVGRPLEEAINIKHRPNRIDFRLARLLLKSKLITDDEFDDLIAKLGYPESYLRWFRALGDANLGVGDVETLATIGAIDESMVEEMLVKMGFDAEDRQHLHVLIQHRQQAEGGQIYRSAARQAYTDGRMAEAQFRTVLENLGVAGPSIDLEIAAVKLRNELKQQELSLAQVKQAFQHGDFSRQNVISRLQERNYEPNDAEEIVRLWESESSSTHRPLSEQRIVQYLLSDVITKQQAYDELIAQGLRPEDANLIVNHPSATGSVYRYQLTPNTVVSALKDKVITVDQAIELLQSLDVDPQEASLAIQIALSQQRRDRKPREANKSLSVADIREALDLGLIELTAAHRYLVQLGYSDADANLLTAIWSTKKTNTPPNRWVVIT